MANHHSTTKFTHSSTFWIVLGLAFAFSILGIPPFTTRASSVPGAPLPLAGRDAPGSLDIARTAIPYALCDDPGLPTVYKCTTLIKFPVPLTLTRVAFKAPYTTTGAMTLQLNGRTSKPLKKCSGNTLMELDVNDIRAGQIVEVLHRETYFLVCSMTTAERVNGCMAPEEEACW